MKQEIKKEEDSRNDQQRTVPVSRVFKSRRALAIPHSPAKAVVACRSRHNGAARYAILSGEEGVGGEKGAS